MDTILTTDRLILRKFSKHDAVDLFRLNESKEVLIHTGDVSFPHVNDAKVFLSNYMDYQINGMGRWAVIRKYDHAFLGWCGLKKHADGMVDLGYRFSQEYWNQGYATEAAQGCLRYGFRTLQLDEIIGRVAKNNHASIKVLEKLGFQYWKNDSCEGINDALWYRMQNRN